MDDDYTASPDQYNGFSLVVTAAILLVLTWLSVALRTYVRAFMTKAFLMDDWLMLVAQGNFTVSCIFILVGIENGIGRHNKALPQWEEILGLKWQALATATYITNMMLIKLSIGVFLLRLATQRRYKWIIWISMGVVVLWSTALFFWDIFQCNPVESQWDYTMPGYTCVSAQQVVTAAYALSVLNVLTDWLYALLPIPMIWKAKMTVQAKATVAVVLGLGIFASIATLIRVKFLTDLTDTADILYAGTDAMVWTLVEPGVAIVASSLVTIRPLLRQMRLRGFESSEHGSSSNKRSNGIWGRYVRSGCGGGGGGGGKRNNSFSSWTNQSGSRGRMPGIGSDDVKLTDLESGCVVVAAAAANTLHKKKMTTRKNSNKDDYMSNNDSRKSGTTGLWSSRETTLTSQTSTHEGGGAKRVTVWGGAVAVAAATVREGKEVDKDEDEGEDDHNTNNSNRECVSPVSPWPLGPSAPMDRSSSSSSSSSNSNESVSVIEGGAPKTIMHGNIQDGKSIWKGEMPPTSPKESEGIQGLRYMGETRRDTKGWLPLS